MRLNSKDASIVYVLNYLNYEFGSISIKREWTSIDQLLLERLFAAQHAAGAARSIWCQQNARHPTSAMGLTGLDWLVLGKMLGKSEKAHYISQSHIEKFPDIALYLNMSRTSIVTYTTTGKKTHIYIIHIYIYMCIYIYICIYIHIYLCHLYASTVVLGVRSNVVAKNSTTM